jgi:hypothetical protein
MNPEGFENPAINQSGGHEFGNIELALAGQNIGDRFR